MNGGMEETREQMCGIVLRLVQEATAADKAAGREPSGMDFNGLQRLVTVMAGDAAAAMIAAGKIKAHETINGITLEA